MKIIKTHKIWSSRIAKNLVRYEYALDYKTVYSAMIDMIKASDEISLQDLRDLSASIASNASSKTRDKAASSLLVELGLSKASKSKTVKAEKPAEKPKSSKKNAGNVVELKSKRAQALAKLQEQDELTILVKRLLSASAK